MSSWYEDVKYYLTKGISNDYALNLALSILEERQNLLNDNLKLQEELQKADSITQSCIFEGKEESTINFRECLNKLKLYKEVIEEVREYIDNNTEFEHDGDEYGYTEWVNIKPQNIVFINELLQILDKAKEL